MNKPVKINEVEKVIRKRLREELPNCKFAVRTRVNAFNSTIDIHLMSADFEALARPVDCGRFIHSPILLNPYWFKDEPPADYDCDGVYLTPEAWNAFKRANNIVQSLRLGDNVYLNFYIGKPEQPFSRLEMEVNDILCKENINS